MAENKNADCVCREGFACSLSNQDDPTTHARRTSAVNFFHGRLWRLDRRAVFFRALPQLQRTAAPCDDGGAPDVAMRCAPRARARPKRRIPFTTAPSRLDFIPHFAARAPRLLSDRHGTPGESGRLSAAAVEKICALRPKLKLRPAQRAQGARRPTSTFSQTSRILELAEQWIRQRALKLYLHA